LEALHHAARRRDRRPSAYGNEPLNKNLVSFELPGDDADDDTYFQRLNPAFERLGRPKHPSEYKWSDDPDFPLSADDVGYRPIDLLARRPGSTGLRGRRSSDIAQHADESWVTREGGAVSQLKAGKHRSSKSSSARVKLGRARFGGSRSPFLSYQISTTSAISAKLFRCCCLPSFMLVMSQTW
jgi:hypothetical protein